MRVVIDTNVWVSGLLWGGQPGLLLKLIEAEQIDAVASPEMLNELARVLGYQKFQKRLQNLGFTVTDLLEMVQDHVTLISPTKTEHSLVQADPDDEIFLHCAISANATVVISGDDHLLVLKEIRGIPIIQAQNFLETHFPDMI